MNLLYRANPDPRLLHLINGWAGHYALLDGIMRVAALFALLPVGVACIVIACFADGARDRRGAWAALIGAGAAWLLSQAVRGWMFRPRPYVYHPLHVLVCYPNDSSFPSAQMAVTAAFALGLYLYRRKWGYALIPYVLITGIARVFCGIEFPLDVIAGWLIGCSAVLAAVAAVDYKRLLEAEGLRITAAVAVVIAVTGAITFLYLPRAPSRNRIAKEAPEGSAVVKDDSSIIKGFTPAVEQHVANALTSKKWPGKIMKVAVGSSAFRQVGAVKFSAGSVASAMSEAVIQREALGIVKTALKAAPTIAEVDVWAVVSYENEAHKQALRVVYSVEAQRKDSGFLYKPQAAKLTPQQALSRFGLTYYRPFGKVQ